MSKIVRQTKLVRKWSSWCGSAKDLERLSNLARDLVEERTESIRIENEKRIGSGSGESLHHLATALAVFGGDTESWSPYSARIEQGGTTITGPAEEVLSEMDRRRVNRVEFKGMFLRVSDGEMLSVEFNLSSSGKAVKLEVSSSDVGWANQAFVRLTDEIDAGKPRLGFIQKEWVQWAFSIIAFPALAVAAYLILEPLKDSLRTPISIFAGFALASGFALTLASGKLFPPVEIVEEGGSGTTSRRLVLLGVSVPLAIAVGVLVNKIS